MAHTRISNKEIIGEFLLPLVQQQLDQLSLLGTISIEAYLIASSILDLSEAERLRRLGIALEDYTYPNLTPEDHWKILYGVYQEAIKREAWNPRHYHALALSAYEAVQGYEYADSPASFTDPIIEIALDNLETLETLEADADMYYLWGTICYQYYGDLEEAIERFQQSLDHDSDFVLARLYLGYSYFDDKQWQKALEAFSAVTEKELADDWTRGHEFVHMAELVAVCHLQLGEETRFEETFLLWQRLCEKYEYYLLTDARWLMHVCQEFGLEDKIAIIEAVNQKIEDAPI